MTPAVSLSSASWISSRVSKRIRSLPKPANQLCVRNSTQRCLPGRPLLSIPRLAILPMMPRSFRRSRSSNCPPAKPTSRPSSIALMEWWRAGLSEHALTLNWLTLCWMPRSPSSMDREVQPVVHSDRSAHYRWPEWLSRIADANLVRSMSPKGNSPDNAAFEGFLGRLKNELIHARYWHNTSIEQFTQVLDAYIRWYHEQRIKISWGRAEPSRVSQGPRNRSMTRPNSCRIPLLSTATACGFGGCASIKTGGQCQDRRGDS